MQKKIIALAVAGLMSGAAFAQTNVTISGLLDVGLNNAKAEGKSASNNAAYNNAGTSQITFRATEALGGGMNAGVVVESNILSSGNGTISPTTGSGAAMFGTYQKFIFVNGGFGELSFGQRTNFSATTATTAQPFGTAMGGGYSSTFGRLRGNASNAFGQIVPSSGSGNRDTRADGSIRYDSPNFQGFTAGLSIKPKNTGLLVNETTPATGHMNLGLNYGVGPMKLSYAYAKVSNTSPTGTSPANGVCQDNVTGVITTTAGAACGAGTTSITAGNASAALYDGNVKHNLLGANYNFGPATVYAGYTTSKGDNAVAAGNEVDAKTWNLGLKYDVANNVAILANYMKETNKLAYDGTSATTIANTADRKLFALGLDYNFSKRTTAYGRYEAVDANTNASGGITGGKLTTYSAGLRHAF